MKPNSENNSKDRGQNPPTQQSWRLPAVAGSRQFFFAAVNSGITKSYCAHAQWVLLDPSGFYVWVGQSRSFATLMTAMLGEALLLTSVVIFIGHSTIANNVEIPVKPANVCVNTTSRVCPCASDI